MKRNFLLANLYNLMALIKKILVKFSKDTCETPNFQLYNSELETKRDKPGSGARGQEVR